MEPYNATIRTRARVQIYVKCGTTNDAIVIYERFDGRICVKPGTVLVDVDAGAAEDQRASSDAGHRHAVSREKVKPDPAFGVSFEVELGPIPDPCRRCAVAGIDGTLLGSGHAVEPGTVEWIAIISATEQHNLSLKLRRYTPTK